MDPTDDPEWSILTDHQKEFYRACVRALLTERQSLMTALA